MLFASILKLVNNVRQLFAVDNNFRFIFVGTLRVKICMDIGNWTGLTQLCLCYNVNFRTMKKNSKILTGIKVVISTKSKHPFMPLSVKSAI